MTPVGFEPNLPGLKVQWPHQKRYGAELGRTESKRLKFEIVLVPYLTSMKASDIGGIRTQPTEIESLLASPEADDAKNCNHDHK